MKQEPSKTRAAQSKQSSDKVLLCIFNYIQGFGYPPNVREICEIVGLSSSSTVHKYMNRLRDQKLINYIDGKSRTTTITAKGHQVVHKLLNQQYKEQHGNEVDDVESEKAIV